MNLVLSDREKLFISDLIEHLKAQDGIPRTGRKMLNNIEDRLGDDAKLKPAQRYFLELFLGDLSKKCLDDDQKDDSVKATGHFAKALSLKIRKSVPDEFRNASPQATPRKPEND